MFDFKNREMVIDKLNELKNKDIPKMSLEKLIEMDEYFYLKEDYENATEDEISECNKHLNSYCERGYNEGKDIFSNEECLFYWGLAHGEMVTNDNGMSRTQYHYLTLNGERRKVSMLLQYHPSGYEINE